MDSITLKEIAGYLSYGLDILPIKRAYLYGSYEEKKLTISVLNRFELKDIKPILWPLSMLTQEIEHSGEKFIPFEQIKKIRNKNWIYFEDENEYCEMFHYSDHTENTYYNIFDFPYEIIEKLYEWHFDLHGLIERGVAIDKSKI